MSGNWDVAPRHSWEQEPVNGITVSGGVGGIRFQWEELERGELMLTALADELFEVGQKVGDIYFELTSLQYPAPYTGKAALDRTDEACRALFAARNDLQDSAARIASARFGYRVAEAAAAAMFGAVRATPGALITGMFGNEGRPTRDSAEAWSSLPVSALLATLPDLQGTGKLRPQLIDVYPVPSGEDVRMDGTLAGLLRRTQLTAGTGAGMLEVVEVDNGPGRRPSYLVSIPGTESGGLVATENPYDETGIAEALTMDSAYVSLAVADALRRAGADPGDAVDISGYSQGGIHAANAAGSAAVGDVYNVRTVVTAGSPVGDIELPAGVQGVHLEHIQDWVPGADGMANTDARNRVSITLHHPVTSGGGEVGLGPGHDLDSYLDGAARADASTDPSLVAVTGVLAARLAGKKGTRHLYRLRRKPDPRPVRKPPVKLPVGPKM